MKMKIFLAAAIFLIILFIYNYIQISKFHINKPNFYNSKLNKALRITQITDYHGNNLMDRDRLIKEVKEFKPHMVVFTGDMIDFKTEDIDRVLSLVEGIQEVTDNTFFVIGNHELRNKKGHDFISGLEDLGVTVLDNKVKTVKINEEYINIVGLSFFATREDYEATIKGIDKSKFTLLLSHSPNRPISYLIGFEDLILSGHTHGGQVRLPIIGPIIAPGQGLFPKYDKGSFELGNTILYIDSGLGNSVFPIRLFNRIQISNITIKPIEENK